MSPQSQKAFRAAPEHFDAVITDQTMPNLSGEDLARELLQGCPDLPIILCTGWSCTMMWEKARELGIRKKNYHETVPKPRIWSCAPGSYGGAGGNLRYRDA